MLPLGLEQAGLSVAQHCCFYCFLIDLIQVTWDVCRRISSQVAWLRRKTQGADEEAEVSMARIEVLRQATAHIKQFEAKQQRLQDFYQATSCWSPFNPVEMF